MQCRLMQVVHLYTVQLAILSIGDRAGPTWQNNPHTAAEFIVGAALDR